MISTVIMAGGKGTRLASISNDIPKSMITINDKPVLEYQIECLKKNSLNNITLAVGHLNKSIKEYFGDGRSFGCTISYYTETEALGTAGALYKIEGLSDDFILINGDIIFDIDFSRMIDFHKKNKALASLAVHPNNHPYDSAILVCNNNDQVISWLNKEDERTYYKNIVNAGIHIISSELLNFFHFDKDNVDLDRDILKPALQTGRIFGYQTPEYIKDMGTPERYRQISLDLNKGLVKSRNLSEKQKCVFLDRDGTINELNGFVTKPEDFTLIEGVAEAVKTLNNLGFLVVVITNQPAIARGEIDFETLDLIHMKMETELGKFGAYIDSLYYCPHHTDKGFSGERAEYKINCDCRKPKPGMLLKAAEKFNIDLKRSFMVGDDKRDVDAGIAAGCIPVFLTNNNSFNNTECLNKIKTYKNLKEFTDSFLDL